jgi:hypothetical protein
VDDGVDVLLRRAGIRGRADGVVAEGRLRPPGATLEVAGRTVGRIGLPLVLGTRTAHLRVTVGMLAVLGAERL